MLTMAPINSVSRNYVSVSEHVQHQGPETGSTKCNAAIIKGEASKNWLPVKFI